MDKNIEKRISSEVTRLQNALANCSEDRKATVDGLIRRAAFMRVKLEDLEEDIKINGVVEMFTQNAEKAPPYERKRPAVEIYLNLSKNYQTAVKQLNDLLPKESQIESEDEFEGFVNGRD